MKKTVVGTIRVAIIASAFVGSALSAQTVTPTTPNGWAFGDGSSGANPAAITGTQPFNGNGSLQFSVPANTTNTQPLAYYLFGAPVALSGLNSLSLGYSFLTPLGTPVATSVTIRLLLTNLTGTGRTDRSDGSFGWYLNGTSNTWQTQNLGLASGDFFFRIGGVGQASTDCQNTASSFDDRRTTISAFRTACNGGIGTKANLSTAIIYGVEVDFGTFNSPSANTAFADQVKFSVGTNNGDYNFETAAPTVTPEPASVALVAFGMLAVGVVARKRNRNS
ncbi:MAG: PEP-CTERM sorting domain-containing protein [Gemmatimonadaceae bacterium]